MTIAADLTLRISEVFVSIQGEGPSAGTPSVFVRLQGCDVGCVWCDTKHSWDSARGDEVALERLLADVRSAGPDNVVVTGGEPLEGAGAGMSTPDALKTAGRTITALGAARVITLLRRLSQ